MNKLLKKLIAPVLHKRVAYPCEWCGGNGKIVYMNMTQGMPDLTKPCWHCDGTGAIYSLEKRFGGRG